MGTTTCRNHSILSFFEISGEGLNPQLCTQEIGLEPTETGLKGEKRRPESVLTLRVSLWSIDFRREDSYSVDEGIGEVLDRVWPARRKIREFLRTTEGVGAGFGSSITIYDERPLYSLSSGSLMRMAFFEVGYGIDIFDYSE